MGLSWFMETIDVLGNPIQWFDGDIGKWIYWILSMVGISFITCTLVTWIIIFFFSKVRWWEFWKK